MSTPKDWSTLRSEYAQMIKDDGLIVISSSLAVQCEDLERAMKESNNENDLRAELLIAYAQLKTFRFAILDVMGRVSDADQEEANLWDDVSPTLEGITQHPA